jgi:hypothetical protein
MHTGCTPDCLLPSVEPDIPTVDHNFSLSKASSGHEERFALESVHDTFLAEPKKPPTQWQVFNDTESSLRITFVSNTTHTSVHRVSNARFVTAKTGYRGAVKRAATEEAYALQSSKQARDGSFWRVESDARRSLSTDSTSAIQDFDSDSDDGPQYRPHRYPTGGMGFMRTQLHWDMDPFYNEMLLVCKDSNAAREATTHEMHVRGLL